MHSGFDIHGIHQHQQQQQTENSCPPLLLSMNPTHIHSLTTTTTQNHLALEPHHHFLPHHYTATGASPYFPINFKLGLNDIFSRNHSKIGAPPDSLLRGSEQHRLLDARQSSLPVLHPPSWEVEVSNENRHKLNQRETLTTCLDAKSGVHFSELEAIYKNADTQTIIQTLPVTSHLPTVAVGHGSASDPSDSLNPAKKKKKHKKKTTAATSASCDQPMAEFFQDLVQQVMDHQESLQKKFNQVMDRLSEERRAREEEWRNQELAHLEREAAARAHDKAMAKNREAMIFSYLEKITGHRINLPPLQASETNTTDDSNCADS